MNTKAALWTGRVLSGLVILFLAVDGAIKLVPIQPVTDSLRELGYPTSVSFARFIGAAIPVDIARAAHRQFRQPEFRQGRAAAGWRGAGAGPRGVRLQAQARALG